MRIKVKARKSPKPVGIITAHARLKGNLKSCQNFKCFGCPYPQSEKYCFPCMQKLLKQKGKEIQKNNYKMEEKDDG